MGNPEKNRAEVMVRMTDFLKKKKLNFLKMKSHVTCDGSNQGFLMFFMFLSDCILKSSSHVIPAVTREG